MLEHNNEFSAVKELAGRLIEMPVLRQFGLVDNEKVDHFLATAFGAKREPPNRALDTPEQNKFMAMPSPANHTRPNDDRRRGDGVDRQGAHGRRVAPVSQE
jgi:hypothetical protein